VENDILELRVPPSKAETHRAFVQAGLANGTSEIYDPLGSADTDITRKMMEGFGAEFTKRPYGWSIEGCSGKLKNPGTIYVGECGFAARVGVGLAAALEDWVEIEGKALKRPMNEGLRALRCLGAKIRKGNGSVRVKGPLVGGYVKIGGSESSQHLSMLLYAGARAVTDVEAEIFGKIVSLPYFELTRGMADAAGIRTDFERRPYFWRLKIPAQQEFLSAEYRIGGDHTSAAHIAEASVLNGRRVRLKNLDMGSRQGDKSFFASKGYAELMGLQVKRSADFVDVEGQVTRGLREDLSQHPDLVPSLAVLEAFAPDYCASIFYGIGFLEGKESKRLTGLAAQLGRVGVRSYVTPKSEPSSLVVYGSGGRVNRDVTVDDSKDHRMKMAFEAAGFKTNSRDAHRKSFEEWPDYLKRIRGN